MFVPPGQGNAPHTHEVEEVFFILEVDQVPLTGARLFELLRATGRWPAGIV